jgi:hypothetical protein
MTKIQNSKKSNSYADIVDFDYYEIALNYIKKEHKKKLIHYGRE